MPIYGYACQNCEHTLDALQKIADEPLSDCPECGQPELKRQLSAPRFRLKGQGWYETDFKTGEKRNLHGDDKSAKNGASKSASDKPAKDTTSSVKKSDSTSSATKASSTSSDT